MDKQINDLELMTRDALIKLVLEQESAIATLVDEAQDKSKLIERLRIRNAELVLQRERQGSSGEC